MTRDLLWDGLYNVRDLGGLPTTDGRSTRWGALVRSDAPSGLTADGWRAATDHGIGTVIDLMETHERRPDAAARPAGLTEIHLPLDGTDDEDFWAPLRANGHWGTSLYYEPYLQRFPHRAAAAVRAFAEAPPGGVLVHCGRGRDRTGIVCMLVLSIAGVRPADIAADYLRSDSDAVVSRRSALGLGDDTESVAAVYAQEATTPAHAFAALLATVDVPAVLAAGGLNADEQARVRQRLVG